MRLASLLYVLFAAAAMQELSSRLGTAFSSARLIAQRQLDCLENTYKRAKQEARKAADRLMSRWRGGEIREVHDEEEASNMEDIAMRTEEFREKIKKLLEAIQAQQLNMEGADSAPAMEAKNTEEEAQEEKEKDGKNEEQVL